MVRPAKKRSLTSSALQRRPLRRACRGLRSAPASQIDGRLGDGCNPIRDRPVPWSPPAFDLASCAACSTRIRRMASAAAAKKCPRLSQCWAFSDVHQPDVRLVDQGCGLERLPGLLLGHLLGRQPAQFLIDQRQELLGRVGIALLDGGEDSGDLVHRTHPSFWGTKVASILADQPEIASTSPVFPREWSVDGQHSTPFETLWDALCHPTARLRAARLCNRRSVVVHRLFCSWIA